MTTISPTHDAARPEAASGRGARIACVATAVLTVPVFLLTDLGSGDSGAAITQVLVEDGTALTTGSLLAVLVAAGLLLSAVRLGRSVGGDAGRVVLVAGSGVAMLYASYYGVFGAGAVVAGQMLGDPGPGLGEASVLLLNMTEIARFAPGLALVAAAVFARRELPRGVWVAALVLLVLVFVPFTAWVAALLTPLWLAVAAASAGRATTAPASGL
jgi:hypothetical protein